MAEETKATAAEAPADVVVPDFQAVVEKETMVASKPEPELVPESEATLEKPAEEAAVDKIAESASFKEETNVVEELPDPQKKAIDEFKKLIREALDKHEFTAPPPPPPPTTPAKEEEEKPKPEAAASDGVKPTDLKTLIKHYVLNLTICKNPQALCAKFDHL